MKGPEGPMGLTGLPGNSGKLGEQGSIFLKNQLLHVFQSNIFFAQVAKVKLVIQESMAQLDLEGQQVYRVGRANEAEPVEMVNVEFLEPLASRESREGLFDKMYSKTSIL